MRCVRALQIQRLEGSRLWGLWGLYVDEPVLIVRDVVVAVGALRFSVGGRRQNGRGSAHRGVWIAQQYCILRNMRHRTSVRAEARGRSEVEDVDSCCAPPRMRRRSEEELRGGEPLDNMHDSPAERTVPQRVCGERGQHGACWAFL